MSEVNPAGAKIFLSYRREDCVGHAGRLYDHLSHHFGAESIFMDIDSIEPGEDFISVIEQTVGACDILIAMIGQHWLASGDPPVRRLEKPEDFVRLEIATALSRGIRVVPVLVEDATMPAAQELPEPLQKLVRRNALQISDVHWRSGVERLVETLEKVLENKTAAAKPQPRPAVEPSRSAIHERGISTPPAVAKDGDFAPPAGNMTKRLSIAIAVILVIASVITALVRSDRWHILPKRPVSGNLSKGEPTNASLASAPASAESPAELVRRTVRPRASRSAEPVVLKGYGERRVYSVWVEGPPEALQEIERVLYHYDHPQFEAPRKESANPKDGFKDTYYGIGAVDANMDIILVLQDGSRVTLKFNMWQALFGNGKGAN